MEWDSFLAFSQPMPPIWQWVGLFISIIAFVLAIMTLPTAFQMWWGRPKIKIRFIKADRNDLVVLQCYIENEPIRSKLLRLLGVRRDPANIAAQFVVRESPNGRQITKYRTKLNVEQGEPSLRVNLEAGLPAIFAVAFQMRNETNATTFGPNEQKISLERGTYDVEISISEHDREIETAKKSTFQIETQSENTCWYGRGD